MGRFNLTKATIPIKYMAPRSLVEVIGSMGGPCAPYLTLAAKESDPIERMKHVMVSSIAYLYPCHNFNKPLNPIVGETYQASMTDGSQIFVEQVSHHPPITYYIIEGPNQIYRFSGYTNFSVKAGLNSISLDVQGNKTVSFADGGKITHTLLDDTFGNTLVGTMHH